MPASRNAYKGYTYQQYIFTLFFAKMDTEREIRKIEAEAPKTKQFDDLYIELEDSNTFRIQIKNYPDSTIEDITITDHVLTIKGNSNQYNYSDNNILVVKTNRIVTNRKFMGLDSTEVNGIVIIPLVEEDVRDLIDDMYRSLRREVAIIHEGYAITSKAKFEVTKADLPALEKMSVKLNEKTIILREAIKDIPNGITYIVGKPGVGKSHYVNELVGTHQNAVIYRFWIDSQDENLQIRLSFKKFIDELAINFFDSPRNFELDELINVINTGDRALIVDGLDHVENYQPLELSKYIDFIAKLQNGRVIVLSRPLKAQVPWEKIELTNWNYEETYKYLADGYGIASYAVKRKIFEISEGYPIITYYIAEHYILHDEICATEKIEDLNRFYDNLLLDTKLSPMMAIFATNHSFFTEKEIYNLLSSAELADAVRIFIKQHPYLFEIKENRISLLHDSLNTYLRDLTVKYSERLECVNSSVKESLRSGNVEYMSRMSSFMLDSPFYDEILILYSSVEMLIKVLNNTIDINSVSDMYEQLKEILENREGVLNIYQYYSFILLCQIVERGDTMEYEDLMFQVMLYMKNRETLEDCIYSSGVIWNLYMLLCGNHEADYRKYLSDRSYSGYHINEVIDRINGECSFFDESESVIDINDFETELHSALTDLEKKEIIIKYLLNIWIRQEKENEYYGIVQEFLTGDEIFAQMRFQKQRHIKGMEKIWRESILQVVKYRLHELGYFDEKNWFRGKTLMDVIREKSPKGSFNVRADLLATLRLANKEKREIDVFSVNYFWVMYQMRKDYSVYNIDDALIIFEEHGQVEDLHSLEIIKRLMGQSEKGIRHLMSSYIDAKPYEFTEKLSQRNYFLSTDCPIDIFDLDAEHINYCTKKQFTDAVYQLLRNYYHTRSVNYWEINSPLHSNYRDLLIDALAYHDFSIYGDGMDEKTKIRLEKEGINCSECDGEKPLLPYIPFEYGHIHENDTDYIRENNMDYLEVAKYLDGNYFCFPYVNIFMQYNHDKIRADYLRIIHTSMFAKIVSIQRMGSWNLFLGNIPKFLDALEIDVDWEKLYKIFLQYLDISMIWH